MISSDEINLQSGLSIDFVHNRIFREPWSRSRRVSRLFIHEKFSLSSMKNDIALLKLDVYSFHLQTHLDFNCFLV